MTTPAEDLQRRQSPERIGRYQVIERIGRGAMGVVYRAHDDAMARDVALKVLMADLEDDPDIRVRFHREAEAAAHLSHPNVITIFDAGEDNGRFYIVMELLSGATLRDFLKQRQPGIGRKLDLMVQSCAGLRAAHNASICHRDIKPGNLFVRSDGLLKILDFGVARVAASSMTATGFVIGTPDYMSPEQARGEDIDDRSDIFSLGGVFYFMLTGRKPFPATQLPALFRQIQTEDPAPITTDEAPADLAAIIMRAIAKRPETRYQNCQELMLDLSALRSAFPLDEPAEIDDVSADPDAAENKGASIEAANEPRSTSTADTVELPPPGVNTDETVTLRPPTWMGRTRTLVDTAFSRTLAHLWPLTPPTRPRQTGIRKR